MTCQATQRLIVTCAFLSFVSVCANTPQTLSQLKPLNELTLIVDITVGFVLSMEMLIKIYHRGLFRVGFHISKYLCYFRQEIKVIIVCFGRVIQPISKTSPASLTAMTHYLFGSLSWYRWIHMQNWSGLWVMILCIFGIREGAISRYQEIKLFPRPLFYDRYTFLKINA